MTCLLWGKEKKEGYEDEGRNNIHQLTYWDRNHIKSKPISSLTAYIDKFVFAKTEPEEEDEN